MTSQPRHNPADITITRQTPSRPYINLPTDPTHNSIQTISPHSNLLRSNTVREIQFSKDAACHPHHSHPPRPQRAPHSAALRHRSRRLPTPRSHPLDPGRRLRTSPSHPSPPPGESIVTNPTNILRLPSVPSPPPPLSKSPVPPSALRELRR